MFSGTQMFAHFGWVWYSYCCQNLAVFTEPCHTPATGSCKTLVLLVLKLSLKLVMKRILKLVLKQILKLVLKLFLSNFETGFETGRVFFGD